MSKAPAGPCTVKRKKPPSLRNCAIVLGRCLEMLLSTSAATLTNTVTIECYRMGLAQPPTAKPGNSIIPPSMNRVAPVT